MTHSQSKIRNIILAMILLISVCPYLQILFIFSHGDHQIQMSFENKELEISLHHETEHTHHHNILDDSDLDHDHHSANHKSDHVIKELPDYTNAAGQIPTITPNFILINSYNYLYELNLFPTDNESYSNFKQIESPPDSITLLKTTVIRI